MASNTSQSKFSLKLMVHKEEKRVIFAEADSNFVDTLFSIMTFPMATIINLFCKCPKDNLNPMGSLNNLYKSLQNLSTNSFASEENKWLLLNPKTSSHEICRKVKLNLDDSEPRRYFICQDLDCTRRLGAPFSTCNLARCSYCGKIMNREITYAKSSGDQRRDQDGGAGVFVSEVTTFIVTDDLRVMPNSPGAIFELLGELGVTSVSCFEEKLFGIGHHQILDLLTGAQLFKNPLTYMVYPNSPFIQSSYDHRPETLVQHLTTKNDTPPKSTRFFKLKITMQKSTCKFLFAEAGSDFVEFLFGFLKIPLATMIEKLRTRSSSYECLKNLLSSISNMSVGECIKSHDRKPQLIATDFLLLIGSLLLEFSVIPKVITVVIRLNHLSP